MPHRLRCVCCGKIINLCPADAGQRVMCPACGMPNQAPQVIPIYTIEFIESARQALLQVPSQYPSGSGMPPQPLLPAPLPQAQLPPPMFDDLPLTLPAPNYIVRSAARPRKADRTMQWVWTILACLCVAGIAVFATAYFYTRGQGDWEHAHRDQILALSTDAAAMSAEGRYSEAYVIYRELAELVSGREIRDAFLAQRISNAHREQQRVYLLIVQSELAKDSSARTPAVAPPSTVREVARTAPPPPLARPLAEIARVTAKAAVSVPAPAEAPKPRVEIASTPPPKLDPPPATTRPAQPRANPPAAPQRIQPLLAEHGSRPVIRPVTPIADELTDEQIGQAIKRGADFLLAQFGDGSCIATADRGINDQYPGINALAVYALLQCGQAINDERLNVRSKRLKEMIATMRDMQVGDSYATYIRGIRATALAVFNRAEDRAALKEDVNFLIRISRHGRYSYGSGSTRVGSWDNSNSQYGLLGVWSGAEVGCEVSPTYWFQVQNHWYECQCPGGDWAYHDGNGGAGTLSMTVAGLASLFVTHDYLDAPQLGSAVGRDPFSPPLARGLAWLESGNNCVQGAFGGYVLYGIERVGLASGFKYFGEHDWYRELAAHLVRTQRPDGSWGGGGIGPSSHHELTETAYSLLFLARGRHPILMNKVRFNGFWANRPRDVANLARFASKELERPLNWQVVPLNRDWTDWMDSPVLYLASHQPPQITDQDLDSLRRFVEAGGMIFLQADGGSPSFNLFVTDLGHRLFPAYEFADLPQDHELYWLHYRIEDRPKLRYIGNGSRIFVLHSPDDITSAWQGRAEKTRRNLFELGVNMFIYAAGKTDLRNRLVSTYIPPMRLHNVNYRIPMAHVKYAGAWNPEPAAFERFSRWFETKTGYALDVAGAEMADLRAANYPVAYLTGTAPYTPMPGHIDAIRRFVEDGGVLIIDACGGSPGFNQSVAASILPKAFPKAKAEMLPLDHPIYIGGAPGMEFLAKPALRTFAEQKMGRTAGLLRIVRSGKGCVIYSALDLTSGLLGTHTWGVIGYQPGYAQSLLKNILLWAADGCPEGREKVAQGR